MRVIASTSLLPLAALASLTLVSAASTDIPTSGISANCQATMNALDTDPTLQTYLTPLLNVTDGYNKLLSSNDPSAANAQLSTTLDNLCKDRNTAKADDAAASIKKFLSSFWTTCTAEIQATPPAGQKNEVRNIYDVLYLISPFQEAICTKDTTSGKYCVQNIASYSTGTASRRSINARQAAGSGTDNIDDAQSIEGDNADEDPNIAFLFLNSTMDKSILCSSCTPQILKAYIGFEMQSPYGIGLSNSEIFKDQHDLYIAVEQQCGDEIMSQINTVDTIGQFLVTQNGALNVGRPVALVTVGLITLVSALVAAI